MPPSALNVLFSFVLSPATLTVADRLSATLMTLIDAISPIALTGSTPTFPSRAARTLFLRLVYLVATLVRISNFGIRASARPPKTPAPLHPAPIAQRPRPGPPQCLPRRHGWLLAALPDLAPAIAADLAALLADPAFAALLAAAPLLHRPLRPLLRGLGLAATRPPPPPAPSPHPVAPPPSNPGPPPPHADTPRAQPPAPKLNNRSHLFRRPICYDLATILPT